MQKRILNKILAITLSATMLFSTILCTGCDNSAASTNNGQSSSQSSSGQVTQNDDSGASQQKKPKLQGNYGLTDEELEDLNGLHGNTGFSCENSSKGKNVILVITDGMSLDMTTLTRWYNDPTGQTPLLAQNYLSAEMNISWANGPITDSAAASTAMATGVKTQGGWIGTSLIQDEYRPFANLTEAAKLAGKKTGIVATVELFHATPAGFTAHASDRNDYENIAEQMAYKDIDVLLGGGNNIDPDGTSPQSCDLRAQTRLDGEDLLTVIKDKGYQYITTKDEMAKINDGKVWGAFSEGSFGFEIDQGKDSQQPTLAEMSSKAIELLNNDNKNGFFLMIEASHIDHGGHNNDPVTTISEVNSWNNAMKVILDFAKEDGNTVVISTSDHATGGLKIGSKFTDGDYSKADEARFFAPLRRAKYTSDEIIAKIENKELSLKEGYKAYGLEPDYDDFAAFKKQPTTSVLRQQLNDKCGLSFSTTGHTGDDVLLYGYSPNNDHPHGYLDNTELTDYICHTLDLNLSDTTSKLFVNVTKGLTDLGYKLKYSDLRDLTATKGDTTIELPSNKNYITINGEQHDLQGVLVSYFSSDLITYGPQEILDLAATH